MLKYIWIWGCIACLAMGSAFAQQGLQVGVRYAMGRTYTQFDYAEASSQNMEGRAGLAVPAGLEIGWLLTPHWRISTGLGVLSQEYSMVGRNITGSSWIFQYLTQMEIPLNVTYRLFEGESLKKGFLLTAGLSYGLVESRNSASTSVRRDFNGGTEEGSTEWMRFQTVSDYSLSARVGIGQVWRLGKKSRFTLESSLIYSFGLVNIWEGSLFYWDIIPPEDFPRNIPFLEVMPEPVESYPSIFSTGSYLAIELRFFFQINNE